MLYSSNHNLLRTIGFIAIIAADSYLHRFVRLEVMQLAGVSNAHIDLIQLYIDQSIPSPEPTKVRNLRPGGTIIVGPPCSTWVFLWPGFSIFCLTTRSVEWFRFVYIVWIVELLNCQRSRSQTERSWANPSGNDSKAVKLANIFVRRLLYMLLVTLSSMMLHIS